MQPGDVISYWHMCQNEGTSLQRGMNYRLHDHVSVILMSRRPGAPYTDQVNDDGQVLIYEGHDVPATEQTPSPKSLDQVAVSPTGSPTQNGFFFDAAMRVRNGASGQELVRVYEKLKPGIWVFNGVFELVDAWLEEAHGRKVFKFKLLLSDKPIEDAAPNKEAVTLDHPRLIPSAIKLEVWKRDKGKCVICAKDTNLHFDHVIPYSLGGSSLVAENIQLLCARHNLEKGAKLQ